MEWIIQKMEIKDLDEVVQIHIKAFPGFFLTLLGRNFLHNLYKNFIRDDHSICLVARKDSLIRGFIVGNLKPEALFRRMLYRRGHLFLLYSLKPLILHPVLVSRKLIYALHYRGERPPAFENAALISSVGVDPGEGSKGAGSLLVREFCEKAFIKGSDTVYLTTDRYDNERVNSFYIRNGFMLKGVIEEPGRREMNRYIKFADEKTI